MRQLSTLVPLKLLFIHKSEFTIKAQRKDGVYLDISYGFIELNVFIATWGSTEEQNLRFV